MEKMTKAFSADISINEGERAVTAKISTAAVDRDGEVLIPMGCYSKNYEKNPVVLLNHSYWDLPVGKCVAIKRDDTSITAKTIFAERPDTFPTDDEWIPDTLLSLFKQNILKAFSVGFDVLSGGMRAATDQDVEKYGASCRRVYSKWELLEYSVVPIPANQEALALAVAKGLVSDKTHKGLFGMSEEEKKDLEPLYGSEIAKPPTKRIVIVVPAMPEPEPKGIDVNQAVKAAIAKKRGVVYLR